MGLDKLRPEKLGKISEFIVKFYDKEFEAKSIEDLVMAPVSAISGVSESGASDLKEAFGIRTVEDLAMNKYVRLAQAVNAFSKHSEKILDKEFEAPEFEKLRNKPASAISGISDGDAALLKRAFGIDTIAEMAENKYIEIAQITLALAGVVRLSLGGISVLYDLM